MSLWRRLKQWWAGSSEAASVPKQNPVISRVAVCEFDLDLELDAVALAQMTGEEAARYREDLIRRRRIAHERDLVWHRPPRS